uniref:Protein cueball n=1 Tax=Cacopsylla melanoneura TaxID=428564 RepID=A0A8D8TP21_9HEMI
MPPYYLLIVFSVFTILPHICKSWDIAVAIGSAKYGEEIELVSSEGALDVTVAAQLTGIRDITYDPLGGFIYVADVRHENHSVFRLNAPSRSDNPSSKLEPVLTKQQHDIVSLAYDPILSSLFWTTPYAISWVSIPPQGAPSGGISAVQTLHSFADQEPHGLVLDTCRRYIFWTNLRPRSPSIERSTITGFNRTVLVREDLNRPWYITIDTARELMYWMDERDSDRFRIERANLDGEERTVIYEGTDLGINSMSIGFGHLYLTNETSVMRLDLNAPNPKISVLTQYSKRGPLAIMTSDENYSSYENNPKCDYLTRHKISSSAEQRSGESRETKFAEGTRVSPRVITETIVGEEVTANSGGEQCNHNGVPLNGSCLCKEGYHGTRCELHLACYNYCVRGTCEVNVEGVAECTCPNQYQGQRCEIDACAGQCLNGGACIVVDANQTHCECKEGYAGSRCEESETVCRMWCLLRNDVNRFNLNEPSNCRCARFHESVEESSDVLSVKKHSTVESSQVTLDLDNGTESLTITSHEDSGSPYPALSTIVITLGVLCALLVLTVIYLSMRIHLLSKRPRIKKRIIVNKTTPLTARPQPDQCEITIENCCNMNICETPCFEPEFRTPIVKSSSSSNRNKCEDKRTLLDDSGDFSS